jgi:class 3 adenylate cyclase
MSIRSYLILSYLALVLLITTGMLLGFDFLGDQIRRRNLQFAEDGVQQITAANLSLSEKVLTHYGEFVVADKAQDVAQELAPYLSGKKISDYGKLRQNPKLRHIATQDIVTPEGTAGYADLIDNRGEAVLHPNPKVEGKNFAQWQEEFPEMWRLVERSFTEPQVSGYYTFLDTQNRQRKKFMALAQVPRSPFIVVAAVNIDEFFLPSQAKITQASQGTVAWAKEAIEKYSQRLSRQVKLIALFGGLAFSLLGIGFGLFFAGAIAAPLMRLRNGVKEIGEGNFAVAVPEQGAREVAELAHAFNELGEQLTDYIAKRDFIRDTFGRYVTQEVVKRLLESEEALALGGETREVSILMSDLRGFTAITAEMEPEEVITFLNRYLGKMIQVLTDYKAVIDEIMGDGILAFFGAPEPLENHAAQAVACALAMQQAMEEINAANAADGLPHLEMGIAVGTGSVVVGNIGSDIRTKYSVVGSAVNFVARMESFALGGQVLISTATFSQVKDIAEVGEVLEVRMKGMPGQATLFEVQGLHGPFNLRLKAKQETLAPLAEKLPVRLYRIRDKVIRGVLESAAITHLCETAAAVLVQGDLDQWEDIRLKFVDAAGQEKPGKIYAKVMSVQAAGDFNEAHLRFTSVSPECAQAIRELVGEG